MGKKVMIFHLNPIEQFPPIKNLVKYVEEDESKEVVVYLLSTYPYHSVDLFIAGNPDKIKIIRIPFGANIRNPALKTLAYLWFTIRVFLKILSIRPDIYMYYETISSLPVLLANLVRRKRLFIHYHEYMSKLDYRKSSFQYYLHLVEKWQYYKASWISHTNELRLELFSRDCDLKNVLNLKVLENFPSKKWALKARQHTPERIRKFVYIGSLSLESMFIKEFADWIKFKTDCSLDIYSHHGGDDLIEFIKQGEIKNINFLGYINYDDIPGVLSDYDTGLIWYRPQSLNFILNATNKLFEYNVCGLEVWVPAELKGAEPYVDLKVNPRVVQVNYRDRDSLDLALRSYDIQLKRKTANYFYENVYARLVSAWLN